MSIPPPMAVIGASRGAMGGAASRVAPLPPPKPWMALVKQVRENERLAARLDDMRPNVDAGPPQLSVLGAMARKKMFDAREKADALDKDNARILSRLQSIHRKPGQVASAVAAPAGARAPLHSASSPSLVGSRPAALPSALLQRRRELERIARENVKILRSIRAAERSGAGPARATRSASEPQLRRAMSRGRPFAGAASSANLRSGTAAVGAGAAAGSRSRTASQPPRMAGRPGASASTGALPHLRSLAPPGAAGAAGRGPGPASAAGASHGGGAGKRPPTSMPGQRGRQPGPQVQAAAAGAGAGSGVPISRPPTAPTALVAATAAADGGPGDDDDGGGTFLTQLMGPSSSSGAAAAGGAGTSGSPHIAAPVPRLAGMEPFDHRDGDADGGYHPMRRDAGVNHGHGGRPMSHHQHGSHDVRDGYHHDQTNISASFHELAPPAPARSLKAGIGALSGVGSASMLPHHHDVLSSHHGRYPMSYAFDSDSDGLGGMMRLGKASLIAAAAASATGAYPCGARAAPGAGGLSSPLAASAARVLAMPTPLRVGPTTSVGVEFGLSREGVDLLGRDAMPPSTAAYLRSRRQLLLHPPTKPHPYLSAPRRWAQKDEEVRLLRAQERAWLDSGPGGSASAPLLPGLGGVNTARTGLAAASVVVCAPHSSSAGSAAAAALGHHGHGAGAGRPMTVTMSGSLNDGASTAPSEAFHAAVPRPSASVAVKTYQASSLRDLAAVYGQLQRVTHVRPDPMTNLAPETLVALANPEEANLAVPALHRSGSRGVAGGSHGSDEEHADGGGGGLASSPGARPVSAGSAATGRSGRGYSVSRPGSAGALSSIGDRPALPPSHVGTPMQQHRPHIGAAAGGGSRDRRRSSAAASVASRHGGAAAAGGTMTAAASGSGGGHREYEGTASPSRNHSPWEALLPVPAAHQHTVGHRHSPGPASVLSGLKAPPEMPTALPLPGEPPRRRLSGIGGSSRGYGYGPGDHSSRGRSTPVSLTTGAQAAGGAGTPPLHAVESDSSR